MNITDLIAELEKIKETHGDLRVEAKNECGSAETVFKEELVIYHNAHRGAHTLLFDL